MKETLAQTWQRRRRRLDPICAITSILVRHTDSASGVWSDNGRLLRRHAVINSVSLGAEISERRSCGLTVNVGASTAVGEALLTVLIELNAVRGDVSGAERIERFDVAHCFAAHDGRATAFAFRLIGSAPQSARMLLSRIALLCAAVLRLSPPRAL